MLKAADSAEDWHLLSKIMEKIMQDSLTRALLTLTGGMMDNCDEDDSDDEETDKKQAVKQRKKKAVAVTGGRMPARKRKAPLSESDTDDYDSPPKKKKKPVVKKTPPVKRQRKSAAKKTETAGGDAVIANESSGPGKKIRVLLGGEEIMTLPNEQQQSAYNASQELQHPWIYPSTSGLVASTSGYPSLQQQQQTDMPQLY